MTLDSQSIASTTASGQPILASRTAMIQTGPLSTLSLSSSLEEPSSPMWDSNAVFAAHPTYLPYKTAAMPSSTPAERRGRLWCGQLGCTKWFKSWSHLIRHERIHTGIYLTFLIVVQGEKPFSCPYVSPLRFHCTKRFGPCPFLTIKRFSRNDNMEQHLKTHPPAYVFFRAFASSTGR
jgi:uncharacterized Zn-finger protein